MPKARVDWESLPVDKLSILVLVREPQREFERLGLGTIKPDDWLIEDVDSRPQSLAGGPHHTGMTRMSRSPKDDVVDAGALVHGIDNLYIAGSSIFPTVGSANPTLTLVATSLKLAGHLRTRLAKSSATGKAAS